MPKSISMLLTGVVLAAALPAQAEERVISDMERPTWDFYGDVDVSEADAEGVPGGRVLRADVTEAGENFWDSAATTAPLQSVAEGEIVTLGFYARAASDGEVWIQASVAQNAAPYDAAVRRRITLSDSMQFYCLEGVSGLRLRDDEARVTLHLASAAQIIELGPYVVTVRDAGDGASQLPCSQTIASW